MNKLRICSATAAALTAVCVLLADYHESRQWPVAVYFSWALPPAAMVMYMALMALTGKEQSPQDMRPLRATNDAASAGSESGLIAAPMEMSPVSRQAWVRAKRNSTGSAKEQAGGPRGITDTEAGQNAVDASESLAGHAGQGMRGVLNPLVRARSLDNRQGAWLDGSGSDMAEAERNRRTTRATSVGGWVLADSGAGWRLGRHRFMSEEFETRFHVTADELARIKRQATIDRFYTAGREIPFEIVEGGGVIVPLDAKIGLPVPQTGTAEAPQR